jgi:two-component system, cell cycle sensor histidine kinase and response regulator CckA
VSTYLSKVMESMARAKALTQQLLTFSKGGTPIRRVEQIAPLLKETCQFALHGSNLRSTYEVQDDLWSSNIDRNQIGQVIQNIVINAMQAMPMGGTIGVLAKNATLGENEHPTLEKGDYVVISVKDQGIGIPEEMLSRIFDPFFTTKIKGHGLGLAISHSIASRHGGAINVQSELGKGTTFSVYLPACREHGPQNTERAETSHTGEGRILVMDDDAAIRTLLSLMLESLGYSVVCEENGAATIDRFREREGNGKLLSAVILDLTIPGGMGGKEVAAEVRRLNPAIPIFVSSGYAEDPIMANPTKYGITASLSKPFRKTELMEMLEKHMRRGKGPASRSMA